MNYIDYVVIAVLAVVVIVIVAVIILTWIVCRTIITLDRGKTERVQHTNETEKAIAETLVRYNGGWSMDTHTLSAKNDGKEKQISYSNQRGKKHNVFYKTLTYIIGCLRYPKKDTQN